MSVKSLRDADYVKWRVSLIPFAEGEANALYPEPLNASQRDREVWALKWDAAFHRAMARLVSEPFESVN